MPALSPGVPQVSCGTPSDSVCLSGFLNLYPFPLGEQSIPGYLSESSLDTAVPVVPHKQSLGTTCGWVLMSYRDAKPHRAVGSLIPICLEHPCRDRELLGREGSL